MKTNIALGQYYPGESFIHLRDARIKILCTIIFIIAVFLCKSVFSYLFLFLFTVFMVFLSKVPFSIVMRSMKPLIIIILITAFLNLFWTAGDHIIFTAGPLKLTFEGINFAILMILRITLLVIGTSLLLSFTTTPIDMTGGLESLLGPLKKIKVPVHEFSMMMMIALRFIPTLMEETQKIINAQKARCADFDSGNILKKVKALVPVLIPLFVSAFRRADELAVAMESRCYHGGDGRTKMNIPVIQAQDICFLIIFAALISIIIIINIFIPQSNFFGL